MHRGTSWERRSCFPVGECDLAITRGRSRPEVHLIVAIAELISAGNECHSEMTQYAQSNRTIHTTGAA
jgi:hypothetical protein